MNTCKFCLLLAAIIIMGCSKSDGEPITGVDGPNVAANYMVLLTSDGILSETLLQADGESISKNPGAGGFETISEPELRYRDGDQLSIYRRNADCTGTITDVDFSDYTTKNINVFGDLQLCDMEVISLAHSTNSIFLVYSIPGSGVKSIKYFLRVLDKNSIEDSFEEEELDRVPAQIVFSNDKLFILSLDKDEDDDKEGEDKFELVVYDTKTVEEIHDLNLDQDVQKIYKLIDGNIIVSYPELHLTVNSITMGILNTVRYKEGKEPNFGAAASTYFDVSGNLYYTMSTEIMESEYPNIPGVYDFSTNTAILYFYENFLTETEREFEFEIGDTSMVSYDTENNLILIGYQKAADPSKGGLLRIKPVPEPRFIDNINLDGVPMEIFID